MSGPSGSRTPKSRAPAGNPATEGSSSKKLAGNKTPAKEDDGKMHHWGWGWGNVVGVIPCNPNVRTPVAWNKRSKFIHYVDRDGNVSSELRPESESSPAPGDQDRDESQGNVLRRLHADEVIIRDDAGISSRAKGKRPETKKSETEEKKPEVANCKAIRPETEATDPATDKEKTKKGKRYIYLDRQGVITSTDTRLSKAPAGTHYIYRYGKISHS